MKNQFKVPIIQNNQWVITEEEQEQQNTKNIMTLGSYAEEALLDATQKILISEEIKQDNV